MILSFALLAPGSSSERILQLAQEGFPGFLQPLLEAASAIAVRAGPGFAAVFVPAIFPAVRVLDFEQLEKFLPVRTLLGERRRAKTGFDPVGRAVGGEARLFEVVKIFVA